MSVIVLPPCECCDSLAVVETVDTIVYDAPVQDKKGRWWSTCHAEGPPHYRCAAHPHHIRHRDSPSFKEWLKSHPQPQGYGVNIQ